MAWYKTWFDSPYYPILYKHRDYEEAEYFLTNILDELELAAGAKVLDLACGQGRHSIFMHQKGLNVLGVDLSRNSIAKAVESAAPGLEFMVHDMRNKLENKIFDAVFNLFTSFGYFDEIQDNLSVFQSVSDMLAPGGLFVLDYLNPVYVEKQLTTAEVKDLAGIRFRINREITKKQVIKHIRITDKTQQYEFQERVSLFYPADFRHFAQQSGMEVQRIFGDYSLAPFEEEESERQIFVFKKK